MEGPDLHVFAQGKTVDRIVRKPFDGGFDGAMESILIVFTDTSAITLRAGSYIIPEEAVIYGDTSP